MKSCKIYKKDKNLILEIPLKQKIFNSYMRDEDLDETDNLVGVITDKEITISYSIDMDYKGKPDQEGMSIIFYAFQPTQEDKEEFRKLCAELGIQVWEHLSCKCGQVIRGSHTVGNKGEPLCWDCAEKIK